MGCFLKYVVEMGIRQLFEFWRFWK